MAAAASDDDEEECGTGGIPDIEDTCPTCGIPITSFSIDINLDGKHRRVCEDCYDYDGDNLVRCVMILPVVEPVNGIEFKVCASIAHNVSEELVITDGINRKSFDSIKSFVSEYLKKYAAVLKYTRLDISIGKFVKGIRITKATGRMGYSNLTLMMEAIRDWIICTFRPNDKKEFFSIETEEERELRIVKLANDAAHAAIQQSAAKCGSLILKRVSKYVYEKIPVRGIVSIIVMGYYSTSLDILSKLPNNNPVMKHVYNTNGDVIKISRLSADDAVDERPIKRPKS